jgi:hypothetical protein
MSHRIIPTHSNGSTLEFFRTIDGIQSRALELNKENFIVLKTEFNGLWSGYSAFKKTDDEDEISHVLEFTHHLPGWINESFCSLYGCSGIAICAYLFTDPDGNNSVIRYCQSCVTSSKAFRDALERDDGFREISLEEADMINVMES